jgi:hypothetical protein
VQADWGEASSLVPVLQNPLNREAALQTAHLNRRSRQSAALAVASHLNGDELLRGECIDYAYWHTLV